MGRGADEYLSLDGRGDRGVKRGDHGGIWSSAPSAKISMPSASQSWMDAEIVEPSAEIMEGFEALRPLRKSLCPLRPKSWMDAEIVESSVEIMEEFEALRPLRKPLCPLRPQSRLDAEIVESSAEIMEGI